MSFKRFERNRIALIPAYNAEYTIPKVVLLTKNYVEKVFIYNDGSTDMTSIMADITGAMIIGNEKNNGKGFALRELFNWAKEHNPEWVVTLDADDQHNPQEIPKLAKFVESGEFDIVIGRRDGMSIARKFVNKLLTYVNGSNLDIQSGFRIYSRNALNAINFKENGFGAD